LFDLQVPSVAATEAAVFRRIRIAILLYVLLFVAAGQYLSQARSTDWKEPLWVAVHPIDGDGRPATSAHIDRLTQAEFAPVERFFTEEARRYGIGLDRPIRFELAAQSRIELPRLASAPSFVGAMLFSLRLRWAAVRVEWQSDLPSPDITLFAVFHEGAAGQALDISVGLQKGLVAVANLYADSSATGSNQVVIAHELLHTLGATDKYDPVGNVPMFPNGYADPTARPLLPQRRAELMAGRIAISADEAAIPDGLREVAIGAMTAREIGWLAE
jgi:hypothetical protein